MRLHRRLHQSLAAALAALALAAPSAFAQSGANPGAQKLTPLEVQYLNSHGKGEARPVVQTPPAAPAAQAADAGFDWVAAAVGASAAAGIIALISLTAPRLRVRTAR